MPGYVATIVLGFAVLVFALIVGLHQLGMLELPASPVAIGFAAALVVIALGIIGASLNQRTGGALTGFGIVALVFSLIWSGGALRAADINLFSNGITTVDENGSTNVFHSGEMDLRHYSTITRDTTVSVDNVFSSVKLIVPEMSDSRIVTAAARSYFKELQDAGVLVFEYRGRMFHAKTLLVDGLYGMVGSANFDNRSFRLNFEVAAVVLDRAFNQQLAAMFDDDLSRCKLVPADRRCPPWQRLFEAVARLASPLL